MVFDIEAQSCQSIALFVISARRMAGCGYEGGEAAWD
jgi:hypothetical protein